MFLVLFVLPKNQKVSSRVSNEVEYIVKGGSLGLYQKEIKRGNIFYAEQSTKKIDKKLKV